jgi:hypothetical protein
MLPETTIISEVLIKFSRSSSDLIFNIDDAHLLSDKEFYKKLFIIRQKGKDSEHQVEIHNQNDIYYLSCTYNQGGYSIKVLCFGDVPYYYHSSNHLRRFNWYAEALLKKKIFGISEIININKDLIKLIKLQIFK